MPEEQNNQNPSLREEIRDLERALIEKRRALSEGGEDREEKEVFREVFKERYAAPSEENVSSQPAPPALMPAQKTAADDKAKTREEELRALIEIAFERGITEAVRIARKTVPWLIDELHDRLIDEYYQKLQQSRQVE